MSQNLSQIEFNRKIGDEPFTVDETPIGVSLLDFWRWMGSDPANNTMRGIVAEFLVAHALGVADGFRTDWDAYDVATPDGIKVEVKCAAYVQRWHQNEPSKIEFGIAPKTAWDPTTGKTDPERKRRANVYVFCLLHHQEKETLDPLRLDQWTFYVLPTHVLDERLHKQKKIRLSSLQRLNPEAVSYKNLDEAIRRAAHSQE